MYKKEKIHAIKTRFMFYMLYIAYINANSKTLKQLLIFMAFSIVYILLPC